MSKPPEPTGAPPPAAPAPPPERMTPLQVLAELELVRRKSELLERRVAAWEQGLNEVRKAVQRLEAQTGPGQTPGEEELAELRHRVARLERRRESEAPATTPPRAVPMRPMAGRLPVDEDAVAVVWARWNPPDPSPGDTVRLTARTDGIEAGTVLPVIVRSLVSEEPLVELQGRCDGDSVQAEWRIPEALPYPELVFEVRHQAITARSPVLVLPIKARAKQE
jgi:hypothetical protein